MISSSQYFGNTGRQPAATVAAAAPQTSTTQPAETSPSTEKPMLSWISLIPSIFSLIDIIAHGVQTVKSDVSLNEKTQAAQDALSTVIAGATAAAPASDQPIVSAISTAAQTTLTAVVTALHATGTPATVGQPTTAAQAA